MKKLFKILAIIFMATTLLQSCSSVSVNGGEEAVLVEKPIIFGKGGVDPEPITSGRTYVAYTTDDVVFNVQPLDYTEEFTDMMTADNTPINLHVYFKIKIIPGKTPVLYTGFGKEWYVKNLQSKLRTLVRDMTTPYKMFDLTSKRDTSAKIEAELFKAGREYITSIGLPVELMQVNVGAATPPQEVLEENKRTAAQNQNKLTQTARASAELTRKQAEINKAEADDAYRVTMHMTMQEYIQMRGLEIEKEKIEIVRDKQNVTIVMGQGLQPIVPIKTN